MSARREISCASQDQHSGLSGKPILEVAVTRLGYKPTGLIDTRANTLTPGGHRVIGRREMETAR